MSKYGKSMPEATGGGGTNPSRMPAPARGVTNAKGVQGGGDTTKFKGTMGSGKSSPSCKGAQGHK